MLWSATQQIDYHNQIRSFFPSHILDGFVSGKTPLHNWLVLIILCYELTHHTKVPPCMFCKVSRQPNKVSREWQMRRSSQQGVSGSLTECQWRQDGEDTDPIGTNLCESFKKNLPQLSQKMGLYRFPSILLTGLTFWVVPRSSWWQWWFRKCGHSK